MCECARALMSSVNDSFGQFLNALVTLSGQNLPAQQDGAALARSAAAGSVRSLTRLSVDIMCRLLTVLTVREGPRLRRKSHGAHACACGLAYRYEMSLRCCSPADLKTSHIKAPLKCNSPSDVGSLAKLDLLTIHLFRRR